jgi:hypothetical protein
MSKPLSEKKIRQAWRNAGGPMANAKRPSPPALPKTVYGVWSTGEDGVKCFAAEPDPESLVMVGDKKIVGEYRFVRLVQVERKTVVRINTRLGKGGK